MTGRWKSCRASTRTKCSLLPIPLPLWKDARAAFRREPPSAGQGYAVWGQRGGAKRDCGRGQIGKAVVDLISDRATVELISWMPGNWLS